MFNLAGKNVILTGGGSGIGKAIASLFTANGATVHMLEVEPALAARTLHEVKEHTGTAIAYTCDVADQQAVEQTISAIAKQGTIDALINNAGIAHVGNIEQTSVADLDRLYAVNVKGVYHCMSAAIPFMKQHGGVIVNMASIASSVAVADRFAYSMTKGAVLTMSYSVAKDYLKHNIRCNTISPARVHTPFVDAFLAKNYPGKELEMFDNLAKTQPIGRMGKPEEVASLALYLCSDEAAFITGSDFPIDGGFIKLNG